MVNYFELGTILKHNIIFPVENLKEVNGAKLINDHVINFAPPLPGRTHTQYSMNSSQKLL